MLQSINPVSNELFAEYPEASSAEIDQILGATQRAAQGWRVSSFDTRSSRMHAAAKVLRDRADVLSELVVREMGKPVAQARAEVEKCAWVCDYYADHAERFLAPENAPTDASTSYVVYRPVGVVLAIMPWNFPFWQVIRFAAPALMAGNGGVLKHASNVMGCAFAIEDVFRAAGFPEDLFRVLAIGSSRVAKVIHDARIAAVTLTGSGAAGSAVASAAGAAIKKTVLELGGSDPYIILEDADLDRTVDACVTSRLINNGQSCVAAKRFIVVDKIRDEFTERFVDQMRTKSVGDPMDESVDVGPLARTDLRDELHRQVEQSVAAGAIVRCGGEIPGGPGAFYTPTVLTDVHSGQAAHDDELFGPAAAIIGARDEAEAIRIANGSIFGLGAAVFTRDAERGERIARDELDAGACFVNAFVKSDPRLPFGGVKASGYGRELSRFGIREFVNIKTVYVQ